MSSCSSYSSSGSACCSPPASSSVSQLFNTLDSAAEFMMVHRDFHTAFDTCSRGLESLASTDVDDNRCGELKAAFCILGVQALAELNQWRDVFPWVLQQYEHQENIPAKIMQMCILLYSKVGKPAEVQEATRVWLRSSSDCKAPGLRFVAELYLLHVLVPLGHFEEARELVLGETGRAAFTEDQRRSALDVVEEQARQREDSSLNPRTSADSEPAGCPASIQGAVIHKLQAMLRCLYRRCLTTGSGSFPLRRVFLAAVLLYMLFLKMDPAHPSSFMWISKLLELIKQTWRAMFAPYYQALT
ncbi:peroxisome assembly protein 26 [Kryptolebias marmoratus]|uniref:Peroxisomal biosis factor 26 n=1 Tax=Kryptolebias marmoratus TaxID=37003 RepID=A0A3Q3AD63_KRYMA|nr:peroxisome assembly protein 26 [Kryptolebias marmoratus]